MSLIILENASKFNLPFLEKVQMAKSPQIKTSILIAACRVLATINNLR